MKQGFMSPILTHPFLIRTPAPTVDFTEKSDICTIMKGLQGFPLEFAPQTIVCRGFKGTSLVPYAFQFSPEAGAPGAAAEVTLLVLIGDRLVLEHSPHKKDSQTVVSHRHAPREKGGLAKRWGCT
jgi:hypothetical protein